jgi:hypothetical protein
LRLLLEKHVTDMHRWKDYQNFDREYPSTDLHITHEHTWSQPEQVGVEFDKETDLLASLLKKRATGGAANNNTNSASSTTTNGAKQEIKSTAKPVCVYSAILYFYLPMLIFCIR